MEIKSIIFCEGQATTESPDGAQKPIIINPTFSFRLKYIPSAFTFCVFIMMQGLPKSDLTLRLVIQEPETNRSVVDSSSVINKNNFQTKGVPDDFVGMNLAAQLANVPLEKEGEYICTVYIDGESKYSSKLYIDRDTGD